MILIQNTKMGLFPIIKKKKSDNGQADQPLKIRFLYSEDLKSVIIVKTQYIVDCPCFLILIHLKGEKNALTFFKCCM